MHFLKSIDETCSKKINLIYYPFSLQIILKSSIYAYLLSYYIKRVTTSLTYGTGIFNRMQLSRMRCSDQSKIRI